MKYLVVRQSDGLVVNAVVWDGIAPYEEPGCYLVKLEDAPQGVWVGWTVTGSEWIAPEPPPAVEE